MQYLKPTIRRIIPHSFWSLLSEKWWLIAPSAQKSRQRLRTFKNKHHGERCFIIGNGPSLKQTDLSFLKNEITFGLNRIYLLFNQLGFTTTYHVTMNRLVAEQCNTEINQVTCPKFVGWYNRDLVNFTPNTIFLFTKESSRFYIDIENGVWDGTTVTYVAMQLAYYMGFQQVVLIGVDHYFETKGKPHSIILSTTGDPNHFTPAYFGKGFRWQLPDLTTSEFAYQLAKQQFERDQREIVDATINGKLQIFRKIDYNSFFKKK